MEKEQETYSINQEFKDFTVTVDGVEVDLNVIGALKVDEKTYLVLTDMPGLLKEDEYHIVELLTDEKGPFVRDVDDEELENNLYSAWEEILDEQDGLSDDS